MVNLCVVGFFYGLNKFGCERFAAWFQNHAPQSAQGLLARGLLVGGVVRTECLQVPIVRFYSAEVVTACSLLGAIAFLYLLHVENCCIGQSLVVDHSTTLTV